MRVFLHANILFSAAKSAGAVRELVRQLLASGHECWVDDYVVIEARRKKTAPCWLPQYIRLRCDALVTGERTHFGPGFGRMFAGVTIHSPRSLAERLFG